MVELAERFAPGQVRDAITTFLTMWGRDASVAEICDHASQLLGGGLASSSVRSYLRLNTPTTFLRTGHGKYRLNEYAQASFPLHAPASASTISFRCGSALLHKADCLEWLTTQKPNSIHAVVTDPPFGLVEYSQVEKEKLRAKKGGVWRIPPSFDGHQRSPVPRFTTLDAADLDRLGVFFHTWATRLLPTVVPGGNVCIAASPLLSYLIANAVIDAGFERRGEIIRLVMTMRGGDRPKNAHNEFSGVSVMPRSMFEPWLLFRKPLEGRVQDNLRKWRTGGLRRPSDEQPFGDVIKSSPTGKAERTIARHPTLKPQRFLRQVVRAMLPLGEGIVLDPFAGSGSTLAAAEAVGYSSVGVEIDEEYFDLAQKAIQRLAALPLDSGGDRANSA